MKVTDEEVSNLTLNALVVDIMRKNYLDSYSNGKEDDYLKGMFLYQTLGDMFQETKVTDLERDVASLKEISEDSIDELRKMHGLKEEHKLKRVA